MRKLLLSFAVSISMFAAYPQCVTNVDFNTWSKTGMPGNGNWVVQAGGSVVRQTVNGSPTFFISPFDLMNVRITGSFRSTDDDDDWMGFVFSFLDPMGASNDYDCWIFDWKKDWQNASPKGMALARADGLITNYGATFQSKQNTPEYRVVDNDFGGPGWRRNFNHTFELRLTYTRASIYVDGNLIFDHQDCYKPGRFGFYNLSQRDCYYSNFQYDLYVDFSSTEKVCIGDEASFDFISPCATVGLNQYQSITWSFGDNTPDVVINNPTFSNVNVKHAYSAVGIYIATMTVVDNNGCSTSASRQVEVRAPITLTPAYTEPLCNGGANGSISVTANGGFGNYSYLWDGFLVGPVAGGRTAGTYTVEVTDGYCNTSGQFTLGQPAPLTAVTSHRDADCGLDNGSATITISGGTPPYQGVSWAGIPATGGPNTFTRAGLGANYYIADFRDANNCSALLQYRETVVALPCGVTSNITKTDVRCFGENNGSITLSVNGGAGGSRISWTGPNGYASSQNSNSSTISGLAAGTYTYTYTDNVGANTFSGTVIITEPGAAMVADINTIGITCAGLNNGQATASVISGGVPPYTYAWNGGAPGNNPVLGNLSPGPVSVLINDSRGCAATASDNISAIPSLNVVIATIMDSCYLSGKGMAIASASGGSAPFRFAWSNFSADSINSNLTEGTYTVTVTDRNNCTVSGSAVVSGAPPFEYTFVKEDILCYGENTGSMTVTPLGGTPGYTIQWDTTIVSGYNPTGVPAGVYSFTLSDAHGCLVYGGDTLVQPDTALIVQSSSTDVNCYGANDGTLTLIVNGGVPPYLYQGNPISADTTVFAGLPPDNYIGIITDSNGCSAAINEVISEPAGPQSLDLTGDDITCSGGTDGAATAEFMNPTGNVIYNWNPGGVLPGTRSGLTAGTYEVSATDDNNCEFTGSIIISEPAAPVLDVTTVDATCFGEEGSATANPQGGVLPFTYTWDDGLGNSFQTLTPTADLPAGNWSVTASDAVPCNQVASFIITEPDSVSVSEMHTDVNCNGGENGTITLTVSGGSGTGFTYVWSPDVSSGNSAQDLTAGDYQIIVADANSCETSLIVSIAEPDLLNLSAAGTDILCFGENSGVINAAATGGTGAYNFTLTTDSVNFQNSTTGQFPGLTAESYIISVTDENGCFHSVTQELVQPDLLAGSLSADDVSCHGLSDGRITITATGGTPGYSFALTDDLQNNSGEFSGLSGGSYTVTITDANGCAITEPAVIQSAEPVIVSILPESLIEIKTGETIQLEVVTNQTGEIQYLWRPDVGLSCNPCPNPVLMGVNSDTYFVDVLTENGCPGTAKIEITVIQNYDVFVPNAFTPDGDGVNDEWRIYGNTEIMKDVNILVFNRWGEKVFETNDPSFSWNGTYHGKRLNPDVYVYYARITWLDYHPQTHLKGSLTIFK